MSEWIVSVPYIPSIGLYCNYECYSEEEARELAKQFRKAEITEVNK